MLVWLFVVGAFCEEGKGYLVVGGPAKPGRMVVALRGNGAGILGNFRLIHVGCHIECRVHAVLIYPATVCLYVSMRHVISVFGVVCGIRSSLFR